MNNLAHSIVSDFAGKSCTVSHNEKSNHHPHMSILTMDASPSVLVDLPHFFATHTDMQGFEIAYFGPTEYEGLVDCESHVIASLDELRYILNGMSRQSAPHVVLADLRHFSEDDRLTALQLLADELNCNDSFEDALWPEQAVISIGCQQNWRHPNAKQAEGRLRRGHTASFHTMETLGY